MIDQSGRRNAVKLNCVYRSDGDNSNIYFSFRTSFEIKNLELDLPHTEHLLFLWRFSHWRLS